MSERGTPFHSFKDLMAEVGQFLFKWSQLEQALACAIRKARAGLGIEQTKVRGSTSERLDLWCALALRLPENRDKVHLAEQVRDQAMRLAKVRNLIVHGLEAGNSEPEDGAPAFIRCVVGGYDDPASERVSFTVDQLEKFTREIDACRRAFMRLDGFNFQPPPP